MPLLLASDANPLGHVLDNRSGFAEVFGADVRLSTVSILVGGTLVTLFMLWVSGRVRTGHESMGNERYVTRGKLAHMIEAMIVYLRDDMLVPVMGEAQTKRWFPFLLSLFFFILTLNLFGLIPFLDMAPIYGWMAAAAQGKEMTAADRDALAFFGGTATASLTVTGSLALCSFVAIQVQGFRELGVKGWLVHLCGGPDLVSGPKALWLVIPIIFVVELLGLLIKPAALAIRLFANMVGGHTLMATIMGFGAMAVGAGTAAVIGISVVATIFAVLISFMELFVSFLQAFIFMFLTGVFISQMSHHDEEHGHEGHEDDHAHGHAAAGHAVATATH